MAKPKVIVLYKDENQNEYHFNRFFVEGISNLAPFRENVRKIEGVMLAEYGDCYSLSVRKGCAFEWQDIEPTILDYIAYYVFHENKDSIEVVRKTDTDINPNLAQLSKYLQELIEIVEQI